MKKYIKKSNDPSSIPLRCSNAENKTKIEIGEPNPAKKNLAYQDNY